jgi:hypothetical protein
MPARGPVIPNLHGEGIPVHGQDESRLIPERRVSRGVGNDQSITCQSITCMIRRERGSTSTVRSFTIV